MLAAGAAFPQMRAQFFPDVISTRSTSVAGTAPGPRMWTRHRRGAGTRAVAVPGVAETSATSREGRASIEIEFDPGWDMARAADDVQDAIDSVTDLPEDAEAPTVRRGAWWDRVTDVVITGPVAVEQLGRFADEFVARLFDAGVTRATIRGVAAPETVVEVPSASLIRHDISMAEIAAVISAEADAAPAGEIDAGGARVRTGAEPAARGDRGPDTAHQRRRIGADHRRCRRIEVDGPDRERAYFVGENPAISIRVDRSEDGDAIAIQQTVEAGRGRAQAACPKGTSIDLIRTRAEAISGRLNILLDNALLGLGWWWRCCSCSSTRAPPSGSPPAFPWRCSRPSR
jgi:multidrug efflux pump subunit AcrB